ncbi:unannotated protein [freshwater metagenome]|uniref:Unannotated protein n=1 Tax=freshwater metagenome TaxID=449393 RepID=A0A6J7SHA6_9ZZZZ
MLKLSAHIASEQLCISQPIVRTRSCTPDSIKPEATIAVEPETDPAVCTRKIGLPTAPSASTSEYSGTMIPSKKSGAFPITMASISAKVICASSSARKVASRNRPGSDTSPRTAVYFVWPTPTTATRSAPIISPRLLELRSDCAGVRARRLHAQPLETLLQNGYDLLLQPCGLGQRPSSGLPQAALLKD